jgi:AcrR family transcriptional regulator
MVYGVEFTIDLLQRSADELSPRHPDSGTIRNMLHAVEKIERTRLSAADWEQAALDLIAAQGVGAVAVEALARRLGVTKGSFYWHFPTREALLKVALERWERQDTDNVLGQVEPIADARARLSELFRRNRT